MDLIHQVYAAAPTVAITPPDTGFTDIGTLVSTIINWAVAIAAVAALIYIVFGGFSWITAGDDAKKMAAAQGKITAGVVGLIIVASAWGIFKLLVAIIPGLQNVFPGA